MKRADVSKALTPGPLLQAPSPASGASASDRPTAIGRYIVLGLVGRGAMGEVYAAYDPELNRKVAIKVLRSIAGDDAAAADGRLRMMREAQAIAKLSHPNVVVVHDVGALGNRVFVAMEFVEGHTVSYWLLAQERAWPDVLKVFAEAGRGLAAAHEKDLVHRDFKPDNVMIGADGQVRVMDFGLARTVGGMEQTATPRAAGSAIAASTVQGIGSRQDDVDATQAIGWMTSDPAERTGDRSSDVMKIQLTQTGAIMGTPAYMSPEQFQGHETDARSDQFSFCVALYEGFYGVRPFTGKTISELEASVRRGDIREPPSNKRVPQGLNKVLLRGLQVDPRERWASMKELLTALENSRLFAGRRRFAAGAAAKLSGVWEAPLRGRAPETKAKADIRAAFLATSKPYAAAAFDSVSGILDRYAKNWSDMYTDVCEATHVRGEQSPEVMDLRMACLLESLDGLRALSAIFRQANAEVVENAVTAASGLSAIERCADVALLRAVVRPPEKNETRASVDKMRSRLAGIRVLRQVGRYTEGLKAIGPLEEEVRNLGYGPLLAETLLELGLLCVERRDAAAAAGALEEAVWTAELSRHEEVTAEAATHLVFVVGDVQVRFDMGEIWSRMAEVILKRMGGHDTIWGWLLNNRGTMREKQGRLTEALSDTRLALAAKEKSGGSNSPDVAQSLSNIALYLLQLGNEQEAVPHIERALKILEERLGADHPRTALILLNYAEILNCLGRHQEACAMSGRALGIFERENESDGVLLTFPLTALGLAHLGAGASDQAVPLLERALAIRECKDNDPAHLGEVRFALARALAVVGHDPARALGLAKQARDDYALAAQRPTNERELARIDIWLAARRQSRS